MMNKNQIFIAAYGQTTIDHINQLKSLFYKNNLNLIFFDSLSFLNERNHVDLLDREAQSQIKNKEKKEILKSNLFILIVSPAGYRGNTSISNWLDDFYYAEEHGIPIVCVHTVESHYIRINGSQSMIALKSSLALWVEMKEEQVIWAYKHWPEKNKLHTLYGEKGAQYY